MKNKINLYRHTPYFILLFMIIIMSILNKEFLTLQTFTNLMQQVSAVGVVALGAMFVIITGGIDFTSGYGLAMTAMAAGTVYISFPGANGVLVLLLISLLVGAALGFTNGVIVAKLKIMPFIATLATMSISQGISLIIGGGNMVVLKDKQILWLGQGKLFGFLPVPFVIFLFVAFIIYILLNKTKLGIYTYAIGSNEEAARYMGVSIDRYKILVYVTAGLCTGIAALLTITRIALITPSIYGSTLLDAIAATIIGGTSASGGRGSVSGTIAGVFIIVIISTALTYLKVPPEMQDFFKGAVIFIAISINAYVNKYSFKP